MEQKHNYLSPETQEIALNVGLNIMNSPVYGDVNEAGAALENGKEYEF